MADFVLVHGAWGGGWGWTSFAPLLRKEGHRAFTPSLTGQGERVHLATPEVNLSLHIEDVLNVIKYEELDGIVLVGHSYGGMVITGVADRIPEKIAHLVYLDAFLPNDGQSLNDLGTGDGRPNDIVDGWRIPFPLRGQMPPDPRRVGQPAATFQEKARLSVPLEQRAFTRTYVKAGAYFASGGEGPQRRGAFWDAAERTRNDPAWRYFELPCGHGMHREMPLAVTGILLEIARGT
jgi:pimeloyl-ACP methyl ester carboxylesterase